MEYNMFNTPDEALEYIKPLVPDMDLARKALAEGLGTGCPDWVLDGILFLLSNTLLADDVKDEIIKRYGNHWIPNTIPYYSDENTYSSN